jgi:sulfite reductase (NADPH) flavoprotein alpha-component
VLSITGIRVWWSRRASGDVPDNVSPADADTVILIGSEGNSTRGFARDLQAQLSRAGRCVHSADMNELAEAYPKASLLFVLTSTYGDGAAPASANRFMERLAHFSCSGNLKFAVLGFGDRQFPRFCQFAKDVDVALACHGLDRLQSPALVDQKSPDQFSQWGGRIAEVTGLNLRLSHNPAPPPLLDLELVDRADFGVEVEAPTSILRFRPRAGKKSLAQRFGKKSDPLLDFHAGDLIGICPPEDNKPRYYSLASSSDDGLLEICVRRLPGGKCSGFLHTLQPGARIQGFIQPNPEFRPAPGSQPVILIGAGAGIGPLAGFIRKNDARHPMYLYWGGRDPQSDFLYRPELGCYLRDQRLTGLRTAFSRTRESAYVQDKLNEDAPNVRQMIEMGAQVLVCGGSGMATEVRAVINDILKPLKTDIESLKKDGRYLEDVY